MDTSVNFLELRVFVDEVASTPIRAKASVISLALLSSVGGSNILFYSYVFLPVGKSTSDSIYALSGHFPISAQLSFVFHSLSDANVT